MIGVNAQIETGGLTDGNVGVGFAVPSNTVKTVVAQLIRPGKVEHASIGVLAPGRSRPTSPKRSGCPVKQGLLVEEVQAGSGAAKAGLKAGTTQVTLAGESYTLGGDIIVAADGKPVARPGEPARLVSRARSPATRSRSRSTAASKKTSRSQARTAALHSLRVAVQSAPARCGVAPPRAESPRRGGRRGTKAPMPARGALVVSASLA